MKALSFAARSLVRQPARAMLGILGVAAVGALLFDMLLLSQGMIVSMRDLLDRTGFDVRVTTTADLPRSAPRLEQAAEAVDAIRGLPGVRTVLAVRFADAAFEHGQETLTGTFQGVIGPGHLWTVLDGHDISGEGATSSPHPGDEVVVNRALASALGVAPGGSIVVRASCGTSLAVTPPVRLQVTGIVSFPFELSGERTIGTTMTTLEAACGTNVRDEADLILAASDGHPDDLVAAIGRVHPELHAATNAQVLGRIEQGGFTYFRQISTVLTTVTVAFALLLICVLLTVSVNQRLGEIAALRALGFSRRRVIADVLSESVLIVGIGGLLSLPAGVGLAVWLDRILKHMPNLPADLHFFVFEPGALVVHVALLTMTAVAAALYPMHIVARLPIAATLRSEVIS
jgi:putative ABC transport system permease protein